MNKKYSRIIIPIILILISINMPITLYLNSFYFHTFVQKYNTQNDITENLLDYLRYDRTQNFIEDENFNEKERSHLLDVKNIIQKFIRIKDISIISLIILFALIAIFSKKSALINLSKGILAGSILTIAIFILFFFSSFGNLFESFHLIFFEPETWLFSQNDMLIILFPLEFFSDITTRIVLTAVSIGVILLVSSYLIYKLKYKQMEKQKK